MRMPKEPTAAQIRKAQSVLAWFAITHDMAARTDDAHLYASAIAKLDVDMVRAAQSAAQAVAPSAYEPGRTGPAYFSPVGTLDGWLTLDRARALYLRVVLTRSDTPPVWAYIAEKIQRAEHAASVDDLIAEFDLTSRAAFYRAAVLAKSGPEVTRAALGVAESA